MYLGEYLGDSSPLCVLTSIYERDSGDEHHSKKSLPEVFSAVEASLG